MAYHAAQLRASTAFKASPVAGLGVQRRHSLQVVARKTAAKTAYTCIDCGYIYEGSTAFEKLPNSYRCPVCQAPKRRFRAVEQSGSRSNDGKAMRARFDKLQKGADDGKVDSGNKQIFVTAGIAGAALLGALYFYLNSQTAL
eukprot:jgi/Chrzof1/13992/Cz08g20130.t1